MRVKGKKINKKQSSEFMGAVVFMVIIFICATISLCQMFVWRVFRVNGDSMYPTLHNDQVVSMWVNRSYHRGSIIGFYNDKTHSYLVKRVIAFGGERVAITNTGKVYINDHELIEPYESGNLWNLKQTVAQPKQYLVKYSTVVPKGKLFVLGDNRLFSDDSRSKQVGFVTERAVKGVIDVK